MEGCFDCPARITSKELAPIHSVKSGILQNACSTSPRVVADLVKSALMRIARLMNSLAKGPKGMVTRSIEHNLRIKNFEARNGNYESNAVVKNQGTKQREQRTLG